ncbi:uncharacterized protein LOC130861412 isoform X1 [Hippopotamus amphibius kiboko]|uniref:uncharacterized protein LOC130861412 isoform X1 n=1 Tax=Hippopotamus amphibius kiboko TaxID=575201 RepID=UPI002592BC1A|nr:uncharacterized protein LOC130861412 isoform X1 [Hippopotamus amphibius kiboko]
MGIFPLGLSAAESRRLPSGSPTDADSGRFRTDPGRRGRGLRSQRAVSGGTPSGRRASAPPLLESSRRPPKAGTCGTQSHPPAPSSVKPLVHTPTRWPKPWRPGQSRLCNATLGPKKPALLRDDPSRLAGGSPKHSKQYPCHRPRLLAGAVEAESSLASLPPSPHSPLEISLINSAPILGSNTDTGLNVTRPGVAGAACQQLSLGPRLCRPSNDNKTFGREPGDRFAPGPDQKPGTPGHIPPLSGRENSSLPPEAPFLVLGKPSGR